METGEAVNIGAVYAGKTVATLVWVELACEVIAATLSARFAWVGEPDPLGWPQDESMIKSGMDMSKSLKVFNLTFMIVKKF